MIFYLTTLIQDYSYRDKSMISEKIGTCWYFGAITTYVLFGPFLKFYNTRILNGTLLYKSIPKRYIYSLID